MTGSRHDPGLATHPRRAGCRHDPVGRRRLSRRPGPRRRRAALRTASLACPPDGISRLTRPASTASPRALNVHSSPSEPAASTAPQSLPRPRLSLPESPSRPRHPVSEQPCARLSSGEPAAFHESRAARREAGLAQLVPAPDHDNRAATFHQPPPRATAAPPSTPIRRPSPSLHTCHRPQLQPPPTTAPRLSTTLYSGPAATVRLATAV